MPQFGYMANPSKKLVSEIGKAKRLGADYVEIPFETANHPLLVLKNSPKIRRELERRHMPSVIHMAYWVDLGSEYEAVRNGWAEECMLALRAASSIGAVKFLVHVHPQHGMSMRARKFRKSIIRHMTENLKRLNIEAAKNGMTLVIENEEMGDKVTIKDIASISKKSGAAVAMDAGHAFIGNGNRTVRDFIRRLGSRIQHCHFSDNSGEGDEHLPIGEGGIDYGMVARELKRTGYDGTITLEIFNGGEKGFSSSLRKIKRMWNA